MNQHEIGRGISLSVGASMLFALLSGYTRLLAPLDGLDIFAWRVVWTLPGALALLLLRQRLPQARALLRRLAREPLTCAALLVVVALLGVQLWIFLWAPLHGRALEVSLGYFLLPLTMVLVGRFYYHERLDVFQWLAVACAVVGVLHELWLTRSFAWPTLVVALGYPPYFVLRRKINADPVVAFALEMALLLPVAVAMLYVRGSWQVVAQRPDMWLFLLPGLGLLSTVALGAYLGASRLLPMALFGILGYVEPVLLVGVAIVFLGESMAPGQLATYIPIWCAVLLTALHSVRLLRKQGTPR
ncbi:eamA-like transporter family protein [Collimonas fungivorans]|jgi:chloramphenicol-sensitive protein RarD|uniref:EamA-like transporter family protein n=1 Tax=Collimonas fungivorans TaxID=158899 RepID=A0A127PE41_9BURK|nr:EamA family transporter RarD [Collimonas fungivorans]AMO95975.1 eamA-like transporter family protein [Collimonas fungivorans]